MSLLPQAAWELFSAAWLFLPAGAANMAPVFLHGRKNLHPMDRGAVLKDGMPLLGSHKTWEGLTLGVVAGALAGLAQGFLKPMISVFSLPSPLPETGLIVGAALGLGAMLGDAAASFIKRREGLKSGDESVLLDRLNSVAGASVAAYLVADVKLSWILIMLCVALILHKLANDVAYMIGLKEVPW